MFIQHTQPLLYREITRPEDAKTFATALYLDGAIWTPEETEATVVRNMKYAVASDDRLAFALRTTEVFTFDWRSIGYTSPVDFVLREKLAQMAA